MAVRRGMPKPEDRSSAQQGIVRDERGQEQPADKRVLNTSAGKSAGKIGAMIRLVIRNSDSPFRRRAISSRTHKSRLIGAA